MPVELGSPISHLVLEMTVSSALSAPVGVESSCETLGKGHVMAYSYAKGSSSKLLLLVIVDSTEAGNPVETTPGAVLESLTERGSLVHIVKEEPELLVVSVVVDTLEALLSELFTLCCLGGIVAESHTNIEVLVSS